MKQFDIVKVKTLDYDSVEHPSDKTQKAKFDKLCREMKKLEGKHFIVSSLISNDVSPACTAENPNHQKIKIDKEEYQITFLEDEIEIVEENYLNNCCRDTIHAPLNTFVCEKCGFSPYLILKQYGI